MYVKLFQVPNVYFGLQRYDDALADARRALDLDPDQANAYSNIGSILFRQGRRSEALDAYSRAIEIDPYMFDAYLNRAAVLLLNGEYQASLKDLDVFLAHSDSSEKAYYYRGLALQRLDWHTEAIKAFDAAIALAGEERSYVGMKDKSVQALKEQD